jgi:hypothetical protein
VPPPIRPLAPVAYTAWLMILSLLVLETVPDGRWRPGIGDPTWTGWLTVAAYALAAGLAWLASHSCRAEAHRVERHHPHEAENQRLLGWFWLLAATTLMVLGINKQLDLQSLLTQVLRHLAHEQGWYDDRRRYQFAFVVAIAGGGVVGVGAMVWVLRRVLNEVWLAILGWGWVTSFVVIRAASFHHVETFLRSVTHAGNVAFELSGIAMVAAAAGQALRVRRKDHRSHLPRRPG